MQRSLCERLRQPALTRYHLLHRDHFLLRHNHLLPYKHLLLSGKKKLLNHTASVPKEQYNLQNLQSG